MNKKIAKLITGIFNPLLMPTLGILILFNTNSYYSMLSYDAQKVIFLTIIISTCLLPLSFLPLFYYQSIIKDINMKSNKERIIPFFVIFVIYFLAYFLLNNMGVPPVINNVILGASITILLLALIAFKWKISAHMAGIGGLIAALLIFSFKLHANLLLYLIIAIVVAGLIGTSRITLKAHTPKEIYSGFGLGVATLLLTFLIIG
jgi:membrane-associated phospholipid phosphatase